MWRVAVALVVFIVIQALAEKNLGLLSALTANVPIFTTFALLSAKGEGREMLVSLGVFTGITSVSFFAAAVVESGLKMTKLHTVSLFLLFWVLLTAAGYFFLKE